MTEISFEQIKDTIEHKKLVLDAGFKFAQYLHSISETELSIELLQRISIHDNSKFTLPELMNFTKIYKTDDCFRNSKYKLSEIEKENIKIHWENNSHHPEHFENIFDMQEIDIIEMVCDWYARSKQYKTDLLEFFNTRQEERFHFPKEIYDKILKYINILMVEVSQ